MPQPSPSDVHVDAALTNLSVGFIQSAEDFVARRVFPVVPVEKKTDKYFVWDRNNFFQDTMQKRAPAAESAGGGIELSTDSYSADVWALHKDVDEQTRSNADPAADPDDAASIYLSQQGLIRQEAQWSADYFVTGVWTTEVTGGTDFTKWDDPASDPEKDVQLGMTTVKELTGYRPNRMIVAEHVHNALKRHPLVKDRFKYTSSDSITAAMLARFFEVAQYVVASGVKATNAEGAATDTYAFILGKHCLLVFAAPAPSLMVPSGGYTFVWRGLTGLNDLGTTIASIPMPLKKADRIEIEMAFDMKQVSAELGYFFLDAVD